MQILTRMCISLDGYLTTPEGWPVQLADPNFSPQGYGFAEFQKTLDAVLMGRTTPGRHARPHHRRKRPRDAAEPTASVTPRWRRPPRRRPTDDRGLPRPR